MTSKDVLKALEICHKGECKDCIYEPDGDCRKRQIIESINVIRELQSDVKILTDANNNLQDLYNEEKEKVEDAKRRLMLTCMKLQTAQDTMIELQRKINELEDWKRGRIYHDF